MVGEADGCVGSPVGAAVLHPTRYTVRTCAPEQLSPWEQLFSLCNGQRQLVPARARHTDAEPRSSYMLNSPELAQVFPGSVVTMFCFQILAFPSFVCQEKLSVAYLITSGPTKFVVSLLSRVTYYIGRVYLFVSIQGVDPIISPYLKSPSISLQSFPLVPFQGTLLGRRRRKILFL